MQEKDQKREIFAWIIWIYENSDHFKYSFFWREMRNYLIFDEIKCFFFDSVMSYVMNKQSWLVRDTVINVLKFSQVNKVTIHQHLSTCIHRNSNQNAYWKEISYYSTIIDVTILLSTSFTTINIECSHGFCETEYTRNANSVASMKLNQYISWSTDDFIIYFLNIF